MFWIMLVIIAVIVACIISYLFGDKIYNKADDVTKEMMGINDQEKQKDHEDDENERS